MTNVPEQLSDKDFLIAVGTAFSRVGSRDDSPYPGSVEFTPNEVYAMRVVLGNFYENWFFDFSDDVIDSLTEEEYEAAFGMSR